MTAYLRGGHDCEQYSTAMIARAILVVLALGIVGVQKGEAVRGASGAADGLTLEQQVGQAIVLSFSGTTLPDYVRHVLAKRRAAGVILFGGNITGQEQLRSLTRDLRRYGGKPIVAVDQEGGKVRRLPWAGPSAEQPKQLARGTVRSAAAAAARALRAAGVTVTFAPVADVPSVRGAALAGRSFTRDPDVASDSVRAAVRGWRSGGVAPTVKHFPGLGGAPTNTDDAIVTIGRSRAALDAVDLPPFRAAIGAGVPLVMVGHARYPALDRTRIASQSRPIVEDLLRDELGFRGVVVTDSLEAQASLATGSITKVSERALRAGADLLLLTGRGSYAPVYEHVLAAARRSPELRARVREAAIRVLALKSRGAPPPG